MPLLDCQSLSHSIAGRPVFADLSVTLDEADRVALVGRNGSGKSSLLKLLAGHDAPDEGLIVRRQGLRLAEVEQFLPEAARTADLFSLLAERLPPESRASESWRVEVLLETLGFGADRWRDAVGGLSGGELNRAMLGRALIQDPDLLLLDEPTNHLDLETQLFFQRLLADLPCALLVVSHDRSFLDAVTNRTLFLRDRRLWSFNMPYSAAREALITQDIAAAEARAAEEKELSRLRASAKRLAIWGRTFDNEKFSRRAKSMEKRISAMAEDVTFVSRDTAAALKLETTGVQARRLVQISGLEVRYGPDAPALYRVRDLVLSPGERLAVFGANGSGKTTLLKQIAAAFRQADPRPDAPVKFNPQVRLGYYDQSLSRFAPQTSLFDAIHKNCDLGDQAVRKELIGAGFPFERHFDPVGVLSGGERARLMFLLIRLEKPNLLILDEPTNHIDLDGKEALEQELLDAGASLIVVSHDRRFIDAVTNRFVLVQRGELRPLDDPEDYYATLLPPVAAPRSVPVRAVESGGMPDASAREDLLAELLNLEEKLAADRARKPAHQKPQLQDRWAARIADLYKLIGD